MEEGTANRLAATTPATPVDGPSRIGGYPVWSARLGPVRLRFVGRGDGNQAAAPTRADVLAAVGGRSLGLAALRQVHSNRVLEATEATPGETSEGDGLWTDRPGLALSVVTADCVPVLLAARAPSGEWRVGAVHAGWRGIVAGVVPRALEALEVAPPRIRAWIGPAIGACCYEVDREVARQVAAAAGGASVLPPLPGMRRKPHLDLVAAVRHQLTVAGAPAPRIVLRCTRCDESALWSYRREGKGAGRNHALVWLVRTAGAHHAERPCE